MKRFSVYGLFRGMLWGISIAAVYFIFLLNFIYNAEVSYNAAEKVTISGHLFHSHVMLLVAIAILIILALTKRYLDRLDPKVLFAGFCALYVAMAFYLILNVDHNIRADAGTVFNWAKRVAEGDFGTFKIGGYIHRYPHQTGLLFYDMLLQKIAPYPTTSFVANFFFVLGINCFVALTANTLFKNRMVTHLTIILSFAFLPQFFFILFAYGLTPGFFFMILGFYNAIRFAEMHRIRNIVCAVIGASIAICFKQNFLIGAIAIVIFWALHLLKSRSWKAIFKPAGAILALLLCMSIPSNLITLYFEEKTEIQLGEGTPSVLWIAMGTDMDNRGRGPGWYNSFNYNTFTQSNFDSDAAAEVGREKLLENIEEMKAEPGLAASFFKEKTVSQWCEPMFQSVWSGPLEACNQYTHTELLQSIYNGGESEDRIEALSKMILLSIFGFTLVFLLFYRKKCEGWELLTLFFIGGLIFHTFWEGKSQYTYPYVFCMIPLASYGIYALSDMIGGSDFFPKKKNKAEEVTTKAFTNSEKGASPMEKIIVEGHRGYCARFPENTLISFAAAIDLGVDCFEFDVWLSKDKIPVLMHDGNAGRTCGVDRWLRDMTLEEIKALDAGYAEKFGDQFTDRGIGVPTLRELLDLVMAKRPDILLGVEIKESTEETVDLTVALLKEYGVWENVYFYAFDAKIIKYLRKKYHARTMGYPDFQMRNFERGDYRYYEEIGISMSVVKSEVFDLYSAKNLPMHLFCADNEADVEICIEKGASLITANDPVPLMKRLGRTIGEVKEI